MQAPIPYVVRREAGRWSFKVRAHARPFAAAIASASGVPVTETN
jgi:hypothetical protein